MQEQPQKRSLSKIFKRIAETALIVSAGLVPIVFLPWTVEPLEVNKQTILLFLATIAIIAWLGAMVVDRKLYFKKSWLFMLVALLLVAVAISSAFSLAPFTSWVGQAKQEYTSFLSFLGYALIFFAGSHFLSSTRVQRRVWSVLLIAGAFVGTLAVLDQIGISIFSTNLVGSPNALGFYLASMAVLGCGLWLVANPRMNKRVLPAGWMGQVVRTSIFITTISALLVALALDSWALWTAIIVGIGIIFVFTIWRAEEFPRTGRFVLPMVLFVCAILFLFLPSIAIDRYPAEVSPSHGASFDIAKGTLSDTSWFVGSGPGTYVMDYTKHHPVEVNTSTLWDQRFDRGSSHILTLLPTIGLIGTMLFIVFILWIIALASKLLITEKAHDEWKMTFVAFSGWSVLAFSMFVYSSNMTLSFLFWLLSAVIVSQAGPITKRIAFSQSPRYGLLTAFLFVLVSVGLLTSMFVTASRYAAEVAFAEAVSLDQASASVDEVIIGLDRAARMNKLSDLYYRNLGNALLVKTAEIVSQPDVNPADVQTYIQLSITSAERATSLSPSYVVNWTLLGDIYREVAPLVQGADSLSVLAYSQAVALSPNNPKYRVMLGRAYLVQADLYAEYLAGDIGEEEADGSVSSNREEVEAALETTLAVAEEAFEKAIELKSDYAPAHYYLAGTYERQGNLTDAVVRMEALRDVYSLDIGIAFQLGSLYLRQGKVDLAQAELERAIKIAPNYSNALWYLSVIYEDQGDIEKTLSTLEKVAELNPDNPMIEQRIERVKSGAVENEIPEPLEEVDAMIEEPVVESE